ncbi:MAG TPA: ABC transporter permease subunit, partial [Clostridiaceae bacterium]|nr:ABC transporter permease subunit [Clostridiaceae bacterium]
MQWIESIAPNLAKYWDKFTESCQATVSMFFIAGGITFILGLFFGVILTVTKQDGIYPNRILFGIVDIVINFFRAIPFLILLIFLIPLTRALTGTAIGVKGAIVPLVFGAVPFYTRQVESALAGVSGGKIEAARSMGSGVFGIVFRVYLHEAVPDLIRATVI